MSSFQVKSVEQIDRDQKYFDNEFSDEDDDILFRIYREARMNLIVKVKNVKQKNRSPGRLPIAIVSQN